MSATLLVVLWFDISLESFVTSLDSSDRLEMHFKILPEKVACLDIGVLISEPGSLHLIYKQREFSIVYYFFLLSFVFQVPLGEANIFMFRNHQFLVLDVVILESCKYCDLIHVHIITRLKGLMYMLSSV